MCQAVGLLLLHGFRSDRQRWEGPGIAHPYLVWRWRLGGIPQSTSAGSRHPSSHSRVLPQGPTRDSHRQEWQQEPELRVRWRELWSSDFLLSSHCSYKMVCINIYYCYQVILLRMRETNLSAGVLRLCWPWSVENAIPLFLPSSSCDIFELLHFLLAWLKAGWSLLSTTTPAFLSPSLNWVKLFQCPSLSQTLWLAERDQFWSWSLGGGLTVVTEFNT